LPRKSLKGKFRSLFSPIDVELELIAVQCHSYMSDAHLSLEDGIMTLAFTRSLLAPSPLNDVSIDASGSWIM